MDVREKLIEILSKPIFPHELVDPTEAVADYLLDSGVTVQEWISVDDRLPEDDSDVLAYLRIVEGSRICQANYANGMWFDWIFNTPVTESITHWMPLPEPPKGE